MNAHQITREFEAALCEYTGAKYAVAVNSCTMALLLAVKWHVEQTKGTGGIAGITGTGHISLSEKPIAVIVPSKTYVSVPQSVIHAGAFPYFVDFEWVGMYRLNPFPVWDSARLFTSGMYESGQFQCVSFHTSKILGDTQGGAILHDNPEADKWFRKARFDGRTEGVAPADDDFDMLGYHCYLSPDVAARLLWKLSVLPKHNEPLPNDNYPDLSKFEVFK